MPRGGARPGAGRKRVALPLKLRTLALDKLTALVEQGDVGAVKMVIDRHWPQLRAITPENSLDGKLIAAKLAELETFEARIAALEEASAND